MKDSIQLSDIQNGSSEALGRLYAQYFPEVLRFVTLNKGTMDEARDCFHDAVFLLVHHSDGQKDMGVFMYSVVRVLWQEQMRSKKANPTSMLHVSEFLEMDPGFLRKTLHTVKATEERIKNLAEPGRTFVNEHLAHDVPLEEIGMRMGFSDSTSAAKNYFKAIAKLLDGDELDVTQEQLLEFRKHYTGQATEDEKSGFAEARRENGALEQVFLAYSALRDSIAALKVYQQLHEKLDEIFKSRDWSEPQLASVEGGGKRPGLVFWLLVVLATGVITFFATRQIYLHSPALSEAAVDSATNNLAEENGAAVSDENLIHEPDVVESEAPKLNARSFMISQAGFFITQHSKVQDAKSIRLRRGDTLDFRTQAVFYDAALDIAIYHVTSPAWENTLRIPYRLSGLQASVGTPIMVATGGEMYLGSITGLELDGDARFYQTDLHAAPHASGAPVVSQNGNVVGICLVDADGNAKVLKSTQVVGSLGANASVAEMRNYVRSEDNRLAGFERQDQKLKMEPFILEVVPFY
ncbi:MAG: hypothetical protein EA392_13695 [Cryomorphaceae bacterium]|nr:MAG: hypothetical protein EA392_13695 [Cryomorphaceae bacterium]